MSDEYSGLLGERPGSEAVDEDLGDVCINGRELQRVRRGQ